MKYKIALAIFVALCLYGAIFNPHHGAITCTSDGYGNQQCQDANGTYVDRP